MTIPACAACVIESNGAGRPPAVTIHKGTALCASHLIESLPESGGSGNA